MNRFTYSKLYRYTAILATVLALILAVLLGSVCAPLTTHAEESNYTDVSTDLKSDSSFSASDYPSDDANYTLKVIQIAEGENDELFVYVYQPYTGSEYDLTATSINISTTVGEDNLNYKNYALTLLSSSGTLHKYIVNNFTVRSATVRYYDISSIFRTYYTAIDGNETDGNTTSELAIAVAQCWAAGEANGETYYDMQETNVVTVEAYAGYVRYWDGISYSFISLDSNNIDSHFIAFSCDYDIDELYEADISFYTVPVTYKYSVNILTMTYSESTTYGDIDTTYYDNPLTIDCGDTVSYDTIGYLGIFYKTNYSWDRICTVSEFIENIENNEDIDYDSDFIDSISDKQWVIRFYETEFTKKQSTISAGSYSIEYTEVTDVTILRLKFLSNGYTYNLGVVCNKITESETPAATVSVDTDDWKDKLKKIIAIVLLVILLIICAPILPYVAKFIVWVISLPFKLIKAIINVFKKKE